MHEAIKVLG